MTSRTIIRRCFVISMDNDVGDVPDCDILVEDGLIAAIGPRLVVADAVEIDGSRTIALHGFVDTHRHTWETTARGILPDCTLCATWSPLKTISGLGTSGGCVLGELARGT